MALNPGDAIRLNTEFTIDDVYTDPTTVTLTVRGPDGSTTSYTYAAAQVQRSAAGRFYYDYVAVDKGLYTYKWVGTGTAAGVDEGSFTVDASLMVSPGLCSVDEVKRSAAITVSTSDEEIAALIAAASQIIQVQFEREFLPSTAVTRRFRFEKRLVDLTPYDLNSVTSIVLDPDSAATTLSASQYSLEPFGKPQGVYTSVEIAPTKIDGFYGSTYTEFGYNVVAITGNWGFPSIPESVSRAAVITVQSWLLRDSGSWAQTASDDVRAYGAMPESTYSIPLAARRLLDPYRRYVSGY